MSTSNVVNISDSKMNKLYSNHSSILQDDTRNAMRNTNYKYFNDFVKIARNNSYQKDAKFNDIKIFANVISLKMEKSKKAVAELEILSKRSQLSTNAISFKETIKSFENPFPLNINRIDSNVNFLFNELASAFTDGSYSNIIDFFELYFEDSHYFENNITDYFSVFSLIATELTRDDVNLKPLFDITYLKKRLTTLNLKKTMGEDYNSDKSQRGKNKARYDDRNRDRDRYRDRDDSKRNGNRDRSFRGGANMNGDNKRNNGNNKSNSLQKRNNKVNNEVNNQEIKTKEQELIRSLRQEIRELKGITDIFEILKKFKNSRFELSGTKDLYNYILIKAKKIITESQNSDSYFLSESKQNIPFNATIGDDEKIDFWRSISNKHTNPNHNISFINIEKIYVNIPINEKLRSELKKNPMYEYIGNLNNFKSLLKEKMVFYVKNHSKIKLKFSDKIGNRNSDYVSYVDCGGLPSLTSDNFKIQFNKGGLKLDNEQLKQILKPARIPSNRYSNDDDVDNALKNNILKKIQKNYRVDYFHNIEKLTETKLKKIRTSVFKFLIAYYTESFKQLKEIYSEMEPIIVNLINNQQVVVQNKNISRNVTRVSNSNKNKNRNMNSKSNKNKNINRNRNRNLNSNMKSNSTILNASDASMKIKLRNQLIEEYKMTNQGSERRKELENKIRSLS